MTLETKIANWLKWDKNEKTRWEIESLVNGKDDSALTARMNGRLVFGTAGVRARMEAGFARLNDLTIIQLSHGFARHVKNVYPGESRGVAIGFDGRHNSRRFARLASNVFMRNGIKVYLFSEVAPTPLVSWATIHLKCDAGLMVTASHNPKEDNGYKAYWSNGAQIIGPHDDEIVAIAEAEPQPRDEYWDVDDIEKNPLFNSADSCIEPYFAAEKEYNYKRWINEKTPIKFTYSAFHGIGYHYSKRMMKEYGFPEANFFSVIEQQEPNPDFPTIPFPNPEDGLKVLTLCLETAEKNGCTVILANDPDADRLQIAEKRKDGSWKIFTGNEMGTLITWWIWKNWREANPSVDTSNIYILNSAVSSQIVKTMADAEGFKNDITLTDFKWMGNGSDDMAKEGKKVILAWEESIGFMPGHTLDKDGVIAAAIFAEMAAFLETEGKSLEQQLFVLYHKYGYHLVRSSYWMVPSPTVTQELFATLRKDLKFPDHIGKEPVKYVRLVSTHGKGKRGNTPLLPLSTSSEMVTFTLENGSIATLRASGTEPTIKYYIELKTAPGKNQEDLASVLDELSALENDVVATLLRPHRLSLSISEQLVEMGFDSIKAEEAAKNCTTLETAMDYLVSRQESEGKETESTPAIAENAPATENAVAGSYQCNDCGKLMKDENAMMFHASKTGHENFEESTESIKPLTEEEKIEAAKLLKEKIKESMKKKAEMEEKEKIEREKRRVQEGKLMLERNEKRKEMEQLAAIAQRKKDKEEEEAAKRRVLEQIKADREARNRSRQTVDSSSISTSSTTPTPMHKPIEKKEYKDATIQIRLPSGEVIRNTFSAQEELAAVKLWIEMSRPDLVPFSLLQPFPRKVMTHADLQMPLSALSLSPSGSLVVTRAP